VFFSSPLGSTKTNLRLEDSRSLDGLCTEFSCILNKSRAVKGAVARVGLLISSGLCASPSRLYMCGKFE